MFDKAKFILEYKLNGKKFRKEGLDTTDYSVSIEQGEDTLKVTLHPKKSISLINAYLVDKYTYTDTDRIYVNGYQSWTTSREFKKDDVQVGLKNISHFQPVRAFVTMFGDYEFQKYSKRKGVFHSYSYTYVNTDGKLVLFGTTNERTGFTVFHFDMQAGIIKVQKDVDGVTTDKDYVLFELYSTTGTYDEVFDAYFAKLALPKLRFDHMSGYTSWYNYFGNISEEQIDRDIDGLTRVGDSADIFQIDDGYQTEVGDWVLNDKFPGGMRNLVDKIHAKGYKAGLWMAPFNATFNSVVGKEHPDWFIRCRNLPKRQMGVISWGCGWTLDFYNEGAANHIRECFNRVLNEWDFDMVKLDFLYSVCREPRRGKSRGEIMCDAMDFLRDCVGDKIILGCGVPLFPAFGRVDFCRISCDVAVTFADPFYSKFLNQELPSARNAMNNTVFRRHLNGRAFGNDPDVFYLRENDLTAKDKYFHKCGILQFTEEQKLLLAEVNNTCGDVLFVSDNVGGYGDKEIELVKKFFKKTDRKVIDAEYVSSDTVDLTYQEADGSVWVLTYNVLTGVNSRKQIK